MRRELFFITVSLITAFLAMLLGDYFNSGWDPETTTFLIVPAIASMVVLAWGLAGYYDQLGHPTQMPHDLAMIMATFGGGLLYGFFTGPINHGGWAWLDGWTILMFAGLVPTLQELNEVVASIREERRLLRQVNDGEKVVPIRKDK